MTLAWCQPEGVGASRPGQVQVSASRRRPLSRIITGTPVRRLRPQPKGVRTSRSPWYLVCATGRTAEEMLAFCRERLANDPERELLIAAEEQRKITRLRLERLLAG